MSILENDRAIEEHVNKRYILVGELCLVQDWLLHCRRILQNVGDDSYEGTLDEASKMLKNSALELTTIANEVQELVEFDNYLREGVENNG